MSNLIPIAALLFVMALAYQIGLGRSRKLASTAPQRAHSRPGYHGLLVALWCGLPALAALMLWQIGEPLILRAVLLGALPPEHLPDTGHQIDALLRRVHNLAAGFAPPSGAEPYEQALADRLKHWRGISDLALIASMASLAVAGLVYARQRIHPELRARNQVEVCIRWLLGGCSTIAILTTVGIVLSMLGEAMHFFSFVNPLDFFFGTTWNPRFSSVGSGAQAGEFGLLPLLGGTLLVSAVALLVAIPLGLMTAIYLSEYASPRFRAVTKPALEVLAGIPTIVYGVFALMVVGPFFSELGAAVGLNIRATSALTAGFVMGVMIIPFVSSLSDDVITQVPRSLRDAALGLGATPSETIRQVVLPAALPGIVGAFLLAASRAIGETMIVVLAAGNSPILHANPFEAVSTVTVSIVNQLTGDTDFASPQSLVAFALGLTLFTITLGLNIIALYIVRKYREQYE